MMRKKGNSIRDNETSEITTNSVSFRDNNSHPKNMVCNQVNNSYQASHNSEAFVTFDFKNI